MHHTEIITAETLSQCINSDSLERLALSDWEDYNETAKILIEERIAERLNEQAPKGVVTNTALARYFRLLDAARDELRNILSRDEVLLMLNANPLPVWAGECETTIAQVIYDEYGLESADRDGPAYRLFEKLANLTTMQQVALLDIVECAWRDRKFGPLEYVCNALKGGEDVLAGRA